MTRKLILEQSAILYKIEFAGKRCQFVTLSQGRMHVDSALLQNPLMQQSTDSFAVAGEYLVGGPEACCEHADHHVVWQGSVVVCPPLSKHCVLLASDLQVVHHSLHLHQPKGFRWAL